MPKIPRTIKATKNKLSGKFVAEATSVKGDQVITVVSAKRKDSIAAVKAAAKVLGWSVSEEVRILKQRKEVPDGAA